MYKKLDEFIKYKNEVNERVQEFESKLEKKKEKLKDLKESYAKQFISGSRKTTDKEIKELSSEIESDEETLVLIKDAVNQDDKLTTLALETVDEYFETEKKLKQLESRDVKEIQEAKQEYERIKKECQTSIRERRNEAKIKNEPRLLALEVGADIDHGRRQILIQQLTDVNSLVYDRNYQGKYENYKNKRWFNNEKEVL